MDWIKPTYPTLGHPVAKGTTEQKSPPCLYHTFTQASFHPSRRDCPYRQQQAFFFSLFSTSWSKGLTLEDSIPEPQRYFRTVTDNFDLKMPIRNMALIESRQEESRYSPFPYSLDPITPVFKDGLIPVSIFAMMSLLSVTALLGFITYRLIMSRKYYRSYVGYNQYIVLIYNLLLADLQQSIAFSISFHWLKLGKILAPTPPCFIQAWFLNIGDVASGFFVLAIAIHTWLGVVKGHKLPHTWFVVSILVIWLARSEERRVGKECRN